MSETQKMKAPPSELDIIKHWKFKDRVYISIICTTFNQEKYIRDAIESFLAQISEYRFEIIIHDDASTDQTASIINGYAQKFPSLITPIIQKENQFSQGKKIGFLASRHANGEYLAFCEGDDYWVNNNKLNFQINELLKSPDCFLAFHPCYYLFDDGNIKLKCKHSETKKTFDTNTVILKGGSFMPTPSMMIKKDIVDNMPQWFYSSPISDYFYQIFGSIHGGALYTPEPMCVYRYMSEGSWTTNNLDQHIEKKLSFLNKMSLCFTDLNKSLDNKFQKEISHYNSSLHFTFAKQAIEAQEFKLFKESITKSWNIKENINSRQKYMFIFRKFPLLILGAFAIKKNLKRIKQATNQK